MMFWNGGHWAFWQVALMWTGMIAFWGLLIWFVYARVTATSGSSSRSDDRGTAGQILDERLARCEIDIDEYTRLCAALTSNQRASHAGSAK